MYRAPKLWKRHLHARPLGPGFGRGVRRRGGRGQRATPSRIRNAASLAPHGRCGVAVNFGGATLRSLLS